MNKIINNQIALEYIWFDINNHLRSKIKVINLNTNLINIYNKIINNLNDTRINYQSHNSHKYIPTWSYDGSSTGQAKTENSEILLDPIYITKHPFIQKITSFLVLCNSKRMILDLSENKLKYSNIENNNIEEALHKFSLKKNKEKEIWFGLEQEFFLFEKSSLKPNEWSYYQEHKETLTGEYYCGINRASYKETKIMEEFLNKCIEINIIISGINQEVECTQWEYQIGPLEGIELAHQMTIAKYILLKICEKYDLYPVFHPKPIKTKEREWNGSGCHVNISTKETREENGIKNIYKIIENMEKDHINFIENYCGKNNYLRLTGKNETSDPNKFTYSIGGRNSSIRIPLNTYLIKSGYFEDRRPGSDIDYYKIISKYLDYV